MSGDDGGGGDATAAAAWDAQVDEALALASIFGGDSVATLYGGVGMPVGEDGSDLRAARREGGGGGGGGGAGGSGGVDGVDGDGDGDGAAPSTSAEGKPPPPLLEVVLLVPPDMPPEGVALVICPAPAGGEATTTTTTTTTATTGDGDTAPPPPPPPPPTRVAHLPPLRLAATLPRLYPLSPTALPACSVSAPWLPADAAARLEAGLGEVWQGLVDATGGEGGGGPALWEWAEWARVEAVPAALEASGPGCGGGIDLSKAAAANAGGGGGGGDDDDDDPLAPAAALAASLLRHAADAGAAAFAASTHACPVCLEEVPGARCVRPGVGSDADGGSGCGHALCTTCAMGLVRSALAPGGAGPRACTCPVPDCGARLDPAVFTAAGLLTEEEATAWREAELAAALASMPDCVRCPHCTTPALADPGDHLAVCPSPACRFAFCGLCLGAWHPTTECMGAAARLAVFRARLSGAAPTGGQLAELRRREEEYLSAAAIERSGAKRCPGCGAAIQRSEGCNKMACPSCGTRFCYRCGAAIESYDHFGAGGCVLFEAAELARWERAVGGGGAIMPVGGLGGGGGAGGGGGFGGVGRDGAWLPGAVGALGAGGGGAAAAGLGAAADRAEAAARNQFWAAVGGAGAHAPGPPRLPRCPRCGQGNARVGLNNHLCCFACRGYFCAACGEGLPSRGGGLHFGKPPKCQQHS